MNVTAQAGDTLFQSGGTLPPDAPNAKRALRGALRAQRKSVAQPLRRKAASAVARQLHRCAALRRARRVAIYLSMGSELMTGPLITALRARRIRLFAPAIVRGHLRFRPLVGRQLKPHRLGMLQPRSGRALRASTLDVVILPLLAFDARGTRLGQGGGYYDRALSRHRFRPYRLGLAYASQQRAVLPREPWDQSLHAVLTERGLHRFPRHHNG